MPITVSCISTVLEKQIVRRASRLIRVRKVRCLRSIRWVLATIANQRQNTTASIITHPQV